MARHGMRPLISLCCIISLAAITTVSHAEGGWLDEQPLEAWNVAGAPVPTTVPTPIDELLDPRCAEQIRPAETAADRAVADAGWYLVGVYRGGWSVIVVTGASTFDGMCRPMDFQQFVFVDGVFTGTVSPVPMSSRFDGAANDTQILLGGTRLTTSFLRYQPSDPLCCASGSSRVTFTIDRTGTAPVLVPETATTQPTG